MGGLYFFYLSLVHQKFGLVFSLSLPRTFLSFFQGEGAGAIGEEEGEELTATSVTGPTLCPPPLLSTGAGCDTRNGAVVAGAERGGGSVVAGSTGTGAAGLAPRAAAAGASGDEEEGLITGEGPEGPSEEDEDEAAVAAVFPLASRTSAEATAAACASASATASDAASSDAS